MKRFSHVFTVSLVVLSVLALLNVSAFQIREVKAQEDVLVIYEDVPNEIYHFKTLSNDSVVMKNLEGIPQFTLFRWGEEASLTAQLIPTDGETELEFELETNKLKWKGKWKSEGVESEVEIEFEPVNASEYGAFEWNTILYDNRTNVFSIPIYTENLKFYYQSALDETLNVTEYDFVNSTHAIKDGNVVVHRPENVVGSYAVYHDTRTNMHRSKVDAEKYKTGKAFHIYRPKLIDREGWEDWATINISNGKLTITLPQAFLDSARYPIIIDPTFGYTTIGSSTDAWGLNDVLGAVFTSPSDAGTATSITAYVGNSVYGDINGKALLILHADLTIVTNGISPPFVIPEGTGAWKTSTFSTSPSLSPSTAYILGIIPEANCYVFQYDSGDTDQGHEDYSNSYASPQDLGSAIHNDNEYSIYCTYTAAAEDETAPTYSDVGTNTTLAGAVCLFYTKWTDETGLATTGGFIFGTNNTGSWDNETWTAFSSNPDWSNKTKTLNTTLHVRIEWCIWANDTSNNWNNTGTQAFKTTGIDYFYGSVASHFSINDVSAWSFNRYGVLNPTFAIQKEKTVSFSLYSLITQTFSILSEKIMSITKHSHINPTFSINAEKAIQFSLYGIITEQFTINHQRAWSFQLFPSITPSFTIDGVMDYWYGTLLNLYGGIGVNFNINYEKALTFTLHPTITPTFTISHTSTGLLPPFIPGGPAWLPARINIFIARVADFYAGLMHYVKREIPVSANVTVENDSPYTNALLSYRIVNIDTNETMREWSEGKPVILNVSGVTNITVSSTVPIGDPFKADNYTLEIRLVLPLETLTASTIFTVDKTYLQEGLRNVAIIILCVTLLGLAVAAWKSEKKPWQKYPEPKTT